jgi:2-polyprenyl-3-methyl-5-hydroxy-6-metoxy-1,4-benzoquinol methylase
MFDKRSNEKEIMDDLSFEGADMDQALRELEFINKWLGGNTLTTSGLEEIIQTSGSSINKHAPLTIADLGCGSGDMLRQIAGWATKASVPVALTGIDANTYIINVAREKSLAYPEIDYKASNIFSEEFKRMRYDIITCTLFTHHFDDASLIRLFSQLKHQANKAILINDLHRHPLAYHSIHWLTAVFSRSPMVKNDAKLSVLRAFSKKDWQVILAKAGITNYDIRWCWAFRWKLIIWT